MLGSILESLMLASPATLPQNWTFWYEITKNCTMYICGIYIIQNVPHRSDLKQNHPCYHNVVNGVDEDHLVPHHYGIVDSVGENSHSK